MKYRQFAALTIVLSVLVLHSEFAAAQEEVSAVIQQSMSPERFKGAGLNKLSSRELENLNKWLQGYRETTVKSVRTKVERQAAELVVSRVDGTFNGISGSTVVKLEDGTVWRQANSSDHWSAPGLDHPGAAITRTFFGSKMRVAGSPEFYVDAVR